MRRTGAVVVLSCGFWGCFKPAIPREDVTDTVNDVADNTVADGVEDGIADVAVTCRSDLDCRSLDGPCTRGACSQNGSCEVVTLSSLACDDGNPCTRDDVCSDGTCQGDSFACDDNLACTDNVCDGKGGCSFPVASARCLIDGACYTTGDPHPSEPCRACEAGRTWSPVNGGPCDDGDACTLETTCLAGVCAGGVAPDDSPEDFLKVFARAEQPIHDLEIVGLVPRASGGTYASLRMRGSVILEGGLEFASSETAHLIVALDENGGVQGAWAMSGWQPPTILGEDLSGRVLWSGSCFPCSITDLATEETVVPDSDPQHLAVLVRAGLGEQMVATPLSHAPVAKDALDRTYFRVMVGSADVVVRGPGASSLTLSRGEATASVWLVRLSSDLILQRLGGIYFESDTPTTFAQIDVDVGPIRAMPDGTVVFPIVSGPGSLLPEFPRVNTTVVANSLMLVEFREGLGLSIRPLLGQLDNPLGFALLGYADTSVKQNEVTFAGRFAGQGILVGDTVGSVPYQSNQYWGTEGSGTFGAGQEAIVARLGPSQVHWFRTVRTQGHPSGAGEAGTSFHQVLQSEQWVIAQGRISGLGAIAVGNSLTTIQPPSEAATYGLYGLLTGFSPAGESRFAATFDDANTAMTSSSGLVFLAGRLLPGTSGVGPTRIVDPDLEVPTPRVYIQRFNSAGGLTCGAGP